MPWYTKALLKLIVSVVLPRFAQHLSPDVYAIIVGLIDALQNTDTKEQSETVVNSIRNACVGTGCFPTLADRA